MVLHQLRLNHPSYIAATTYEICSVVVETSAVDLGVGGPSPSVRSISGEEEAGVVLVSTPLALGVKRPPFENIELKPPIDLHG
jgi:hypothetical protein